MHTQAFMDEKNIWDMLSNIPGKRWMCTERGESKCYRIGRMLIIMKARWWIHGGSLYCFIHFYEYLGFSVTFFYKKVWQTKQLELGWEINQTAWLDHSRDVWERNKMGGEMSGQMTMCLQYQAEGKMDPTGKQKLHKRYRILTCRDFPACFTL